MAGGETEIPSANPPPDLEPNTPPLIQPPKSNRSTEQQPWKYSYKRRLKEHRLRLRELPNGIKREEGFEENGSVIDPITHRPFALRDIEELAAVLGSF